MAGEWKRATWTYDAIGLGHTNTTIMEAMEDFLISCGWERAAWDDATTRHFLRADRLTVLLTNDLVGVAGNVAITKTDPNSRLTLAGMSGGTGSVAATGSIAFNPLDVFDADRVVLNDGVNPAVTFEFEAGNANARGKVAFLGQPADGSYVTISDGVNAAVTFEFDSNASVVESTVLRRVVIGGSLGVTMANLLAAVNAAPVLDVTANAGLADSVTLTADTPGATPNVTLLKSGANLVVTGMTGGGGGAGVIGSNIPVARGASVEDTIVNFVAAVNAAPLLNITARWANRWAFNGDGYWQHCGIQVFNDTGNSRIIIRNFLQKLSKSGLQSATNVAHQILIAYSNTAPNIFTFYGGEYGFYGELGRDGLRVNLAHWAVLTFEPLAELFGTDDERVTWTTQGICMDLFGNLKFAADRNSRMSDAAQANRNFTGTLNPYVVRGTNSFDASVQADDRRCAVGAMDSVLGMGYTGQRTTTYAGPVWSFGMIYSPRDGRYRVSPMVCRQLANDMIDCGVYSASVSVTLAPSVSTDCALVYDVRRLRRVAKAVVVDSSLLGFVNVTDQVTGKSYYVVQVADGGRTANIGLEYTATVVAIATTPT